MHVCACTHEGLGACVRVISHTELKNDSRILNSSRESMSCGNVYNEIILNSSHLSLICMKTVNLEIPSHRNYIFRAHYVPQINPIPIPGEKVKRAFRYMPMPVTGRTKTESRAMHSFYAKCLLKKSDIDQFSLVSMYSGKAHAGSTLQCSLKPAVCFEVRVHLLYGMSCYMF